jgi:hypothetical protein
MATSNETNTDIEKFVPKGTFLAKTCVSTNLCNIYADGAGSTYTEIVEENSAVCVLTSHPTVNNLQLTIDSLKQFLSETDYKMTVDYFGKLQKDQQDSLISSREQARILIKEYKNQILVNANNANAQLPLDQNFVDDGYGNKFFVCPK